MTALNITSADCSRLMDEAASIAALALSNANIKTLNEFLPQVDFSHAYKVFVRRPTDFVNWIANCGGAQQ